MLCNHTLWNTIILFVVSPEEVMWSWCLQSYFIAVVCFALAHCDIWSNLNWLHQMSYYLTVNPTEHCSNQWSPLLRTDKTKICTMSLLDAMYAASLPGRIHWSMCSSPLPEHTAPQIYLLEFEGMRCAVLTSCFDTTRASSLQKLFGNWPNAWIKNNV